MKVSENPIILSMEKEEVINYLLDKNDYFIESDISCLRFEINEIEGCWEKIRNVLIKESRSVHKITTTIQVMGVWAWLLARFLDKHDGVTTTDIESLFKESIEQNEEAQELIKSIFGGDIILEMMNILIKNHLKTDEVKIGGSWVMINGKCVLLEDLLMKIYFLL